MAGRKLCCDRMVDLCFEFPALEIRRRNVQLLHRIGQRGNAVVGRERDPHIGQPDLMSEKADEVGEFAIEIERHLLHLGGIRADLMAENIVGREADGKQIGSRAAAYVFVLHQLLGEFEFVFVGERGRADNFIEAGFGSVFAFAMRGRAENRSLRVFPFAIPIFRRACGVEILHPLGKIVAIVSGCDPGAGRRIDPVGSVSGEAGGKNGGAVFQRNSEDAGFALRGQLEFISQRVGQQIVRRGADLVSADADQFRGVVFDRGDHVFLLLVPPFVGGDAVAVAVGAGKQRGVSGGGAGVGVVVVAVRKVGAMIEEQAESAVAELVAIALEIIAAKLVDHDDHNQLGMSVVGGGEAVADENNNGRKQISKILQ